MRFLCLVILAASMSCNSSNRKSKKLDIQGHRGARGLAPENTIPAFWKALSVGVTTLEMDLAVTRDKKVVLSHEPWFSHLICKDSSGMPITEARSRTFNIYKMTYNEVQQFDCGSVRHPGFPEQELISIHKPLLVDVISSVEQFISQRDGYQVSYNIEIKSTDSGDGVFHPAPNEFSDLVYSTIDGMLSWERVTIQSFDFRVLQYFNKIYPDVRLAALIENDDGIKSNLDVLGFVPDIYSCYYKLLDQSSIEEIHDMGMLVIPWTVNEIEDMEQLYNWGVDGLITDYPNRVWQSGIPRTEVFDDQN